MKIRIVQHDPVPGDYARNIERILTLSEGDDALILTPFAAVCGLPWDEISQVAGFDGRMHSAFAGLTAKVGAGRGIIAQDADEEPRLITDGSALTIDALPPVPFLESSFIVTCDQELEYLEDMEQADGDLICVMSALPFTDGSDHEARLSALAKRLGKPVFFANQCGATDGIVYAGGSAVFASDGTVVARLSPFEEGAIEAELGSDGIISASPLMPAPDADEALLKAATLAIHEYAVKCRLKNAVVGVSGGMDSALVLSMAADALGAENVHGVLMPSQFSTDHSLSDAEALCKNLGVAYDITPIADIMGTYRSVLEPCFAKFGPASPGDLTWDNIQARIRGVILMTFCNRLGGFVLGTGNKSENAMGYCTLYGDTVGGLEPLADIYKTRVYAVARKFNELHGGQIIPEHIFTKAPSAELHPDQTDQDSLPPYEVLDEILRHVIELGEDPAHISIEGISQEDIDRVIRLLRISEFKRKQTAPGVRLTNAPLGSGWSVPVCSKAF